MPAANHPTILRCTLLLAAALGGTAPTSGQGFGADPFGSTPASRPTFDSDKTKRAAGGLSEFATDETVVSIEVRGNKTVPATRITGQMQTRVGRPYDPKALGADVRKLASLPYFVTVRPLTEPTEGGRAVILEVVERTTIRYVEYLGNESIKNKKLAQETGLKVGGAIDPYAVDEGRRRIEELYKTNGFGRVVVTIQEGQKPSDRGVVYVVNEGPKQKVWDVEFEGNTFASDGQLKTKIKTKNSLLRLWGGKINEEQLEEDVRSVTDYYRSYGFFRARVGRVIEYNEEGEWATLKFAVDEGPRYAVRNITVNGVEKFAPEDVTTRLRLLEGAPFERDLLNADIEWIKQLYGSKGYVYADIRAETVFLEEPGKIDLVFAVAEGSRFRVGEVYVQINGEAAHTKKTTALNRLSIRPGDLADTREFRASERRLQASGLFNTNPSQGQTPTIRYQISEPSQVEVASRAERRTAYKPPVPSVYEVRQVSGAEIDAALAGGESSYAPPGGYPATAPAYASPEGASWASAPAARSAPAPSVYASPGYAPAASAPSVYAAPATPSAPPVGAGLPRQGVPLPPRGASQAAYNAAGPAVVQPTQYVGNPVPSVPVNTQLFPSPVFAPTPVPAPGDPTVDLYVNLEETQTGRFMVGVAVNSDAGLVGQILLDEQNFDWRRPPTSWQDWRDGTAWRGGGQRFRLEAAPGTEVQRYVASWQEPYLLDTPISLSLSGSYFDRRFEDWDENRVGGRVGLGYQWTDNDLSLTGTYRGESIEISGISAADRTDIPDYAAMEGNNSLHGFGLRLVNDTRDNPFLATEGYYLSASVEQVVGSFDYPRAELEGRTYYLLRERPDHTGRHVMVLQSRVAFTGSDTPIYDRYFAGGFSTMRGFDFMGASPVAGPNNAMVGGDFRWLNTVEYMFPLSADGMINGVAFCDFGTTEENVEINDFRVAPGLGLRLTVPAMGPAPIALDFSFPVSSADFDDEQIFSFNVGFMR